MLLWMVSVSSSASSAGRAIDKEAASSLLQAASTGQSKSL